MNDARFKFLLGCNGMSEDDYDDDTMLRCRREAEAPLKLSYALKECLSDKLYEEHVKQNNIAKKQLWCYYEDVWVPNDYVYLWCGSIYEVYATIDKSDKWWDLFMDQLNLDPDESRLVEYATNIFSNDVGHLSCYGCYYHIRLLEVTEGLF